MRYRVIQEHDRRYPIRLMCRALAVSPTGYYAWRTRPASGRATANQTLLTELRQLHHESRQTYGSPRMWRVLVARGRVVGRHRVARLMRHDGLRAKTVTKWRATTQSSHSFPVAANQLNRSLPSRLRIKCGPGISPISGPWKAGSIWRSCWISIHEPWWAGPWGLGSRRS